MVPAYFCLFEDGIEIGCKDSPRARMFLKPNQLRMMTIPFCLPPDHFLGKQRFTPERNKPLGVKIAGVKCPESHTKFCKMFMHLKDCTYELYFDVIAMYQ